MDNYHAFCDQFGCDKWDDLMKKLVEQNACFDCARKVCVSLSSV